MSTQNSAALSKFLSTSHDDFFSDITTYLLPSYIQNDEEDVISRLLAEVSTADFSEIVEELHQHAEELNASIVNNTENAARSMLSSDRFQAEAFSSDTSEKISHRRSLNDVDSFIMTLRLWMKKASITRRSWKSLQEVLSLLRSVDQLKSLSKNLGTFRKRIKAQLSLLKMRRKKLTLDVAQMLTLASLTREDSMIRKNFMYFFNLAHFFKIMLSTSAFINKLHLDIVNFVDRFSELWKSYAWESFIHSCLRQFAHCNVEPLFSSNVIHFKCFDKDCRCDETDYQSHIERITCVDKDHTSNIKISEAIVLVIQRLAQRWKVTRDLQQLIDNDDDIQNERELFVLEDVINELYEKHVLEQLLDVHLDYYYENSVETEDLNDIDSNVKDHVWVVRCIIHTERRVIKSLNQLSSSREELEIKIYEHDYFVTSFIEGKCLSVSFLCFVNDFDLFRNMYQFLMKIYAILTEMMIRERIRRVNVFSLTLESHDVEFLDVIDALQFLEDLDKRLRMNIQEEQMLVCAYILTFIEDMSQQNANFDCKASIAVRDCRCYVIKASEQDNLKYDVLEQE